MRSIFASNEICGNGSSLNETMDSLFPNSPSIGELDYTPPKFHMEPENEGFFSKRISPFCRGRFSGSMWNFRGVHLCWNKSVWTCGWWRFNHVPSGYVSKPQKLLGPPSGWKPDILPSTGWSDITRPYKSLKQYTDMSKSYTCIHMQREQGRYQKHICIWIFPDTDQVWWNTSCKVQEITHRLRKLWEIMLDNWPPRII